MFGVPRRRYLGTMLESPTSDAAGGDVTADVVAGSSFCWTRYGTESGEQIQSILARKSAERMANGGEFLWGIGNSVRRAIPALLAISDYPEVRFSSMLSPARIQDREPSRVRLWLRGETWDGRPYVVPDDVYITSNGDVARAHHFALVCSSASDLEETDQPALNSSRLRNLLGGTPVGHSQVTAIVRTVDDGETKGPIYRRGFVAKLVPPYFVTLTRAIEIPSNKSSHAELSDLRAGLKRSVLATPRMELLPGFD